MVGIVSNWVQTTQFILFQHKLRLIEAVKQGDSGVTEFGNSKIGVDISYSEFADVRLMLNLMSQEYSSSQS